jgi:L-ascorbate metabolism protein UlaG (beta-lactamase superfamily)
MSKLGSNKIKITKFVHSCLLVELGERVVLCDPGQFSWESGLFDINKLNTLDQIVITHEHFDHFHLPFLQALMERFPDVPIISTQSVKNQLEEKGFNNIYTESNILVEIFSSKRHASLDPLGATPENIAVHIFDTLTVGGDRHDLEKSKTILALPVTAPWGSMMGATKMALDLAPKHIIPIHDWHWSEIARQQAYARLKSFFAEKEIIFHDMQDGVGIDIEVDE